MAHYFLEKGGFPVFRLLLGKCESGGETYAALFLFIYYNFCDDYPVLVVFGKSGTPMQFFGFPV